MNSQYISSRSNKTQAMLGALRQYPGLPTNLRQQYNKMVAFRLISENLLVFLLQFTGLNFTILNNPNTPVWLASGTACAFAFLRGYSILPGIWLGSLTAYLLASYKLGIASTCASIYTLEAWLLLWGSYQFIKPTLIYYRVLDFAKFLLYSCSIAAISSLTLELLFHSEKINISFFLTGWLANINGILTLGFALVTWDAYFPQIDKLKRQNKLKIAGLYGSLTIFVLASAMSHQLIIIAGLASLIIPLIAVISFCYGWCGAIMALTLIALLQSFACYLGAPLFDQITNSLILQILLIVAIVTGVSISISKQRIMKKV